VLDYDERQGGYVVDLDKERLQNAPHYGATETPDWSSRDWPSESMITTVFRRAIYDDRTAARWVRRGMARRRMPLLRRPACAPITRLDSRGGGQYCWIRRLSVEGA